MDVHRCSSTMLPITLFHQKKRPKHPPFIVINLTVPNHVPDGLEPRFPEEIWEQVFTQMDSPSDLFNVIQTCRKFYRLGLRPLYASLQYYRPYTFLANRTYLWKEREDALEYAVTDMVVKGTVDQSRRFNNLEEDDMEMGKLEGLLRAEASREQGFDVFENFVASRPKSTPKGNTRWLPLHTNPLVGHIFQFTNLVSLTFSGMHLPYEMHHTIRLLPNLKHLAFIETSTFLPTPNISYPPRAALPLLPLPPLLELVIWQHDWRPILSRFNDDLLDDEGDIDNEGTSEDYTYNYDILQFMFAPTLRILRMDWNTHVAKLVSRGLRPGRHLTRTTPNPKPNPYTNPSLNPFMQILPSQLVHLQVRYAGNTPSGNGDGRATYVHLNRHPHVGGGGGIPGVGVGGHVHGIGGGAGFPFGGNVVNNPSDTVASRQLELKVLADFVERCERLEEFAFANPDDGGGVDIHFGCEDAATTTTTTNSVITNFLNAANPTHAPNAPLPPPAPVNAFHVPNNANINILPHPQSPPVPVHSPNTSIPHSSWSHLTSFSGPAKFLPLLSGSMSRMERLEVSCVEPGWWRNGMRSSRKIRRPSRSVPGNREIGLGLGRSGVGVGADVGVGATGPGRGPWGTVNRFVSSFFGSGNGYGVLEFPSLHSLSLVFDDLEEGTNEDLVEVLGSLAESGKYAGLEEVKVRWVRGAGVSEATLLSLGAQILSRFPRLKVVHLYKVKLINIESDDDGNEDNETFTSSTSDDTSILPDSASPDVSTQSYSHKDALVNLQRGYVAAWRLYCHQLREVKLSSELVWRNITPMAAVDGSSSDGVGNNRNDKGKRKATEANELQPDGIQADQWTVSAVEPTDWEYDATWTLSGRLGVPAHTPSPTTTTTMTRTGWRLRGEGDVISKLRLDDWNLLHSRVRLYMQKSGNRGIDDTTGPPSGGTATRLSPQTIFRDRRDSRGQGTHMRMPWQMLGTALVESDDNEDDEDGGEW